MERPAKDPVRPAPAQLATTLIKSNCHPRVRISTGYRDVDNALGGGFDCGKTTSISGAAGTGKSLLAFQTVTTYLLAEPLSHVALIDTSGLFSPRWLYEIVCNRLRSGPEHLTNEQIENEAIAALERVKVMRVFDLVGVTEAVAEVRELCDNRRHVADPIEKSNAPRNQAKEAAIVSPTSARVASSNEYMADQRTEIPDSESDNSVYEEDTSVAPGNTQAPESASQDNDQAQSANIGLFIVDNITSVVNEATRSQAVKGQALLTAFLRSLSLLAEHRFICVLLLNNAVGQKPFIQRKDPGPAGSYGQDTELEATKSGSKPAYPMTEDVSIFSSSPGKPALGRSFGYCVDVHVWLSKVPWRINDSELIARGREKRAKYVRVLEVLADRVADRQGRWGGFGEGELLIDSND